MSITKKAIDLEGLHPETKKRLDEVNADQSLQSRGVAGDPILEPVPEFIKTSNDKVIENGHNAWIVLTRDRNASRLSGFGGLGHTHCAAIDLVVGRMGHKAKSYKGDKKVWVDPDFEQDAARVYISQKCNIDEYFGLTEGLNGNIKTRSGIGIKADNIRVVSREGIKLVTGVDKANSQGGDIGRIFGVDIIAGNNSKEVQPMTKGLNTREALVEMAEHIDKLNGIVDSLLQYQMVFNEAITNHIHFSPFYGLPTSPSPVVQTTGMSTTLNHLLQTKQSLISHKINLKMFKQNYLAPSGAKYILSRWNGNN